MMLRRLALGEKFTPPSATPLSRPAMKYLDQHVPDFPDIAAAVIAHQSNASRQISRVTYQTIGLVLIAVVLIPATADLLLYHSALLLLQHAALWLGVHGAVAGTFAAALWMLRGRYIVPLPRLLAQPDKTCPTWTDVIARNDHRVQAQAALHQMLARCLIAWSLTMFTIAILNVRFGIF